MTDLLAAAPSLERIPDAQVPPQGDGTHMHDAGGTCQHVAGHVDIAPHQPERPVPCRRLHAWQNGGLGAE